MREFAKEFYNSQQWKKTRDLYAASVGRLCERCLRQGKITAGEIVHHKIFLTPDNVGDPSISLDWHNLELVCRDCHAKIHKGETARRYKILGDGTLQIDQDTPHITIL